jgi:hypothetical protein
MYGAAGGSVASSAAGLGASTAATPALCRRRQIKPFTKLFASGSALLGSSSRPHKHPHPRSRSPASFSASSASYARWRRVPAAPGPTRMFERPPSDLTRSPNASDATSHLRVPWWRRLRYCDGCASASLAGSWHNRRRIATRRQQHLLWRTLSDGHDHTANRLLTPGAC